MSIMTFANLVPSSDAGTNHLIANTAVQCSKVNVTSLRTTSKPPIAYSATPTLSSPSMVDTHTQNLSHLSQVVGGRAGLGGQHYSSVLPQPSMSSPPVCVEESPVLFASPHNLPQPSPLHPHPHSSTLTPRTVSSKMDSLNSHLHEILSPSAVCGPMAGVVDLERNTTHAVSSVNPSSVNLCTDREAVVSCCVDDHRVVDLCIDDRSVVDGVGDHCGGDRSLGDQCAGTQPDVCVVEREDVESRSVPQTVQTRRKNVRYGKRTLCRFVLDADHRDETSTDVNVDTCSVLCESCRTAVWQPGAPVERTSVVQYFEPMFGELLNSSSVFSPDVQRSVTVVPSDAFWRSATSRPCVHVHWDQPLGLCVRAVNCGTCMERIGVEILAGNKAETVLRYVNRVLIW